MKGIIFSGFIEMVEGKFSPEIVDDILDESDLPSGGIYTAVGTYDHAEIIQLVGQLSKKTGIPVDDLVHAFGEYLFGEFAREYPQFFQDATNSLEFLLGVHNYIHVEVKKLYPDAELPAIKYERPDSKTLVMNYSSNRPFAKLAEGLIKGCIAHFKDNVSVSATDTSGGTGCSSRFTLQMNG